MLVSISAAKLTEGQDVTEVIAQWMLYPSSHILTACKLFTDWFSSNLTNKPKNVFPQPRSCAAKPTQDFFPAPMFHCITSQLCWCSCLQDNTENQEWHSAKKLGFRGYGGWVVFNNAVSLLSHITGWFWALLWQQLYWHEWWATKVAAFQILPLERSSDLLNQKKPWGDLVYCSLCHDWPLQISRGGSFIMLLIKTGFLTSFNYSSPLLLVPKSSHSWKYSVDELWLMLHWSSS